MSLSYPIRRTTAMLKPLALAAGVLLAAALPTAEAGVVVQTAAFAGGGDFNRDLPRPDGVPFGQVLKDRVATGGTMSFNRFDPALGKLTGVTWELLDTVMSFELVHRAQVTSLDPLTSVVRFTLGTETDQRLNIGGSSLLGTGGSSFNLGAGVKAGCEVFAGGFPLLGSPGCSLPTNSKFNPDDDKIKADAAAFLGAGSFTEEVDSELAWADRIDLALIALGGPPTPPLLGPGPAEVFGRFDFSGAVRLTYVYEALPPAAVPEPGTLWMVAGLLPLLVLRGRRHGR